MDTHKCSCEEFITALQNKNLKTGNNNNDKKKIRISAFAESIPSIVQLQLNFREIELASECVDIDKDGYIDKYDLETFLARFNFF